MSSYLRCWITATLLALTLGEPALGEAPTVPPVPPEIQVPAGTVPFLKGHAVGTQNYICLLSASGGLSWTFFGPQATLFLTFNFLNSEIRQQITTHFLSPNPDESGTARPTWQSSFDTSAVWGRAVASSMNPNFVAPGAIPWLRLEVVGTERGPTGGAFLTQTTFIQRLNTSGGMAPSTGCSIPGATMFVPYTADYFFYKADR
jgi:hypothetical protein